MNYRMLIEAIILLEIFATIIILVITVTIDNDNKSGLYKQGIIHSQDDVYRAFRITLTTALNSSGEKYDPDAALSPPPIASRKKAPKSSTSVKTKAQVRPIYVCLHTFRFTYTAGCAYIYGSPLQPR